MKKLTLAAIAAITAFAANAKTSTPEGWTDDYDVALSRAKAEGKYVVADFSGSDWCGWCKRLDSEVFATDVFRKGAAEKYVLLMIDSPSDSSLLSEKAKEQNPKLVEKYGIKGFPTVLVLDADGEVVARLGYAKGGPEKYLETLAGETYDAPIVKKYIKPIESILNRHDEEMNAEFQKLLKVAQEKFPMPSAALSKKASERVMKNARAYAQKEMFTSVVPKFISLFEKAIAEAKAIEVPENMKSRKDTLIAEAEANLDMLKSAKAKHDAEASKATAK